MRILTVLTIPLCPICNNPTKSLAGSAIEDFAAEEPQDSGQLRQTMISLILMMEPEVTVHRCTIPHRSIQRFYVRFCFGLQLSVLGVDFAMVAIKY